MTRPAAVVVAALTVAAALGCAAAGAAAGASVRAHPGGELVLEWRGTADAVTLRGSMSGWEPVPLVRSGKVFRLTLALAPGRYEYRLEVRRGGTDQIVLPEGSERADDGFGGENAVVRVP